MSRFPLIGVLALATLLVPGGGGLATELPPLVVYGGMHQTLALGRHEARVRLADLLAQPDFYAVGAVEGLQGEITILDSVAYVTAVSKDGRVKPLEGPAASATLLAGQAVARWAEISIAEDVAPDRFDDVIRDAAAGQGIDPSVPFMFIVEGALAAVRLHVINGACPVHARVKNLEIAADRRPYEHEWDRLRGTVVGVYAPDAVGKLTHPATRTHAHLIYADEASGLRVTGHLERVGIAEGATLKVPRMAAPGREGDR